MSRFQIKSRLIRAFDHNPATFNLQRSDRQFFINALNMANDNELRDLLSKLVK